VNAAERERRRVAYHEAGHAAVALMTKRPVHLVSIRPTRSWSGVCFSGGLRLVESDYSLDNLNRPTPLLPAKLRRAIETQIMGKLAGGLAEELAGFHADGYVSETPDERQATAIAKMCFTARQRELLATGDNDLPSETDAQAVRGLAYALAGDETAVALIAWLRAETRQLIYSPRCRRLVDAIAAELLEHETVGASRLRAIYREVKAAA